MVMKASVAEQMKEILDVKKKGDHEVNIIPGAHTDLLFGPTQMIGTRWILPRWRSSRLLHCSLGERFDMTVFQIWDGCSYYLVFWLRF